MLWLSNLMFSIFNFLLGTVIGSFLNVVIYRVPNNQSIVSPPSHCPICGHKLKWYDMIPIFSYIFLKGRCRYCSAKISSRYPLIEALTGFAFVGIGLHFGWSLQFFEYIILSSLLITIFFTDLFYGIVPDVIVIPGAVIGLIFSLIRGKSVFISSLFGMLFLFGFFLIVILATRGGMGEGDATFGAMIGSFIGLKFSIATLVISFILGSIVGIILLIFFRKKGKDSMPFGPYLAISAYIMLLYGYQIIFMYQKMFAF